MSLPSLPLKDGVLEIDNSFIEKLITCPRALDYAYLQKRVPSSGKPALNFGSVIHAALEARYKRCKNVTPDILDEQSIIEEVILPYFANNPQPEDDHRTPDFAIELFRKYNQIYNVEPFSLLVDEKGDVISEISFSTRLTEITYNGTNIPVNYVGRIDLPVLWDGQIIIIDHKTTSMLGGYYFDGQKVNPQFEGYCWAFEKTTGRTVNGFAINAIRTKAMPAKPRTGWDAWWSEGFGRHKEYLRPCQLEEWHTNVLALIDEFIWHYGRGYMPMKKKACTLYGKCSYYDVCYLPMDARQQVLGSDQFQANEWSPLKNEITKE